MKRILYFFFTVLLSTAIKAQTSTKIDTTQFVAFYNYSINTLDEKGKSVIDSLRLALLVGNRATYCTTLQTYNKDGRASQEMLNAFIMHHQNVTTDMEKNEVIAVEPIYPYRYESHEPLAQVDWKTVWQTMDSMVLRGNSFVCRSLEIARLAWAYSKGRGFSRHTSL